MSSASPFRFDLPIASSFNLSCSCRASSSSIFGGRVGDSKGGSLTGVDFSIDGKVGDKSGGKSTEVGVDARGFLYVLCGTSEEVCFVGGSDADDEVRTRFGELEGAMEAPLVNLGGSRGSFAGLLVH